MTSSNFNPSTFANDMQLRTRKELKFDEVEASLPDPKAASSSKHLTAQASQVGAFTGSGGGIGGFLAMLGNLNPFGRQVSEGDLIWLFDNTAFQGKGAAWQAEFVAAVFEKDDTCKVVDMVSGIASTLGLADDAAERQTIEERLMPFLWDVQVAKTFRVNHLGKTLKLSPTSINGITTSVNHVSSSKNGSLIKSTAQAPRGVTGILDMQTFYAEPEGWGIISDVDDTIKITMTSDPTGILRETFVNPATPCPGMPELYAEMQKSILPANSAWFYLSASPYNLYPFLRDFRDQYFPAGTMILRDFSWKTIAGLLSALTMGTEQYKADRMKKIHSWLPKRKMIVIGDSTQSDPEAYGEIYRTVPGWIKMILIRKATDVAAIGIADKNEPQRFETAFKDIPREAWHVFKDPAECTQIIRDVVNKG